MNEIRCSHGIFIDTTMSFCWNHLCETRSIEFYAELQRVFWGVESPFLEFE